MFKWCSNQIRMEKSQFYCYTVVAEASLVEEYSVHCITRLFSLFCTIYLVDMFSMFSQNLWKGIPDERSFGLLFLVLLSSFSCVSLSSRPWLRSLYLTWEERSLSWPKWESLETLSLSTDAESQWEEQNWSPFDWIGKLILLGLFWLYKKKNPYA